MQVTRLDIAGLRRFSAVSLSPGPGLNLIIGDNGAGKTSILEALHLMAYGRSFRGRVRDGLIAQNADAVEVFVQWLECGDRGPPVFERIAAMDHPSTTTKATQTRRAGLRHSGQAWEGRLDGVAVGQLSELCAALAVVTFEPGSHSLLSGGGEQRRRFIDWGLFHVEQAFLPLWRRYARALKQRNALLKQRRQHAQLEAWEHELADAGEPLSRYRQRYLEALQPGLQWEVASLLPNAGEPTLTLQPGWRHEEMSLADALLLARERDITSGHTSVGPHRADWRIEYPHLPGREALSRGQAKLTVLSLLLAQAAAHAAACGEWPVVGLDDLASELDRGHQRRVLQRLVATGAQVFISGTEPPSGLDDLATSSTAPVTRFHVEQGRIHPGMEPEAGTCASA